MNQLLRGGECHIGMAIRSRSSSSIFSVRAPVIPLIIMPRWVCMQPFGFPVVPDVYSISARSLSETETGVNGGAASRSDSKCSNPSAGVSMDIFFDESVSLPASVLQHAIEEKNSGFTVVKNIVYFRRRQLVVYGNNNTSCFECPWSAPKKAKTNHCVLRGDP